MSDEPDQRDTKGQDEGARLWTVDKPAPKLEIEYKRTSHSESTRTKLAMRNLLISQTSW